jgi:preprotein translocase subunit SecD
MAAAESIIQVRLVSQNITDSEVYTDYDKNRIIVRFPWKAGETDFDPEKAIAELGEMANLTFRELAQTDALGMPAGETLEKVVLEGRDIKAATAAYDRNETTGMDEYFVQLELNDEGAVKFSESTGRLVGQQISIWMDNVMISAPVVNSQITGGKRK